ncbi:MAG: sodium/proline symporter [Chlamydiales bacterium]|jgi:sodium/proline symporter
MLNPTIISFLVFMGISTFIGLLSAMKKRNTTEDYLLASRDVGPWAMALSCVASNNSGFMFVGLIGTTYLGGLSTIWIMIGWIFGDYFTWFFVHKNLREQSEALNAKTIPSMIATSKNGKSLLVSAIAGIILVAFLGTYSAAQFKAGSKALHVLFGWDYSTGAILGATITVLYCLAGGIRASIWTDVYQSVVMIVSISFLCFTAFAEIGGVSELLPQLRAIDPSLTNLIPENLQFGFALYALGWAAAGIGVVGQPHIMVRAMVIESSDMIKRARRIYVIWYVLFTAGAILTGLLCRIIIPELASFDPELALPRLSQVLLPQVFVGFILAGLFSASMSTADSQILSCSAAITHDIFRVSDSHSLKANKLATLLIACVALFIALSGSQNVFTLVVLAWSGLASTLGPLVILRSLRVSVGNVTSILMMFSGLSCILIWRFVLGYSGAIYDALPGMAASFLVFGLSRLIRR